ncbi:unnamed protein product [Lymnaea stagnalis]|uniref:FHA domain-containing protein n=1 Tax=Lymnaea stagnalis TaxID=6523 RepID=A0AAV2HTU7_LYMST
MDDTLIKEQPAPVNSVDSDNQLPEAQNDDLNKINTNEINETDGEKDISDGKVSSGNKITTAEREFAVPIPLSFSLSSPKVKKDNNILLKSKSERLGEVPEKCQIKFTENHSSQNPSNYQEPEWSGLSESKYSFDVLKNGSIIDTISLNDKPFYIFGRLPSCDVTLEHPSLSRYHAVVQYRTVATSNCDKGWYIYDLDSTHGTWVNKNKISPKEYHRLKVGYVVKFGGSSRLHILQGPSEDEEEESEMTITEIKAQKMKFQKEAEILQQLEMQEEMQRLEEEKKMLEDKGCGWGMGDDAEEQEEGETAFGSLIAENESLYIDDPKKALKGFYEREGCDLPDYQFTDIALGKHKCRLELPVDGPNGEELVAEALVSGKRKDAVIACALEACRILDRLGLLRSSTHESRKRKQKKWEDDDYYDSDEDTFLDRTGTIEKKRVMRMKKAGKDEPETYDSLLEKYNKIIEQIQNIESKLQKAKADAEALASEEMDELDAYMVSIKAGAMDTKTRMQLKGDLLKLKMEEQKLRKLVNIAKPATLPPLKPHVAPVHTPTADVLSRKLHAQQKQLKKANPIRKPAQIELKPDDYEELEEHEDEEQGKTVNNLSHMETDITKKSLAATLDKRKEMDSSDSVNKRKEMDSSDCGKKRKEQAQKDESVSGPSKIPVKGPVIPALNSPQNEQSQSTIKPSNYRSTSSVLSSLDKQAKKDKVASDQNFDGADPNYAMWLPPTEQSGDGRTSLNDKLGY